MYSLFQYKIVNYDKNSDIGGLSGLTLFFSRNKNSIKEVSEEVKNVLKNADQKLPEALTKFNKLNFNDKSFVDWLDGLDDSAKSSMTAGKALEQYQSYLESTAKKSSSFAEFTKKAGSALKSFAATAINAAMFYAISKGIEFAIQKWEEYSNVQEEAIERGQKALETYNESAQKVQSAKQVVASIAPEDGSVSRWEELSKGVNRFGENVSLSTSEFEEYQSIASQIANAFPELVSGYNSLGEPILTAANNVETLKAALQEQQDLLNKQTIDSAQDFIDAFNAQNNQYAYDSTKEAGWKQQIDTINELENSLSDRLEQSKNKSLSSYLEDFRYWLAGSWEPDLDSFVNEDTVKQIAEKLNLDITTWTGNIDWDIVEENKEKFIDYIADIQAQQEEAIQNAQPLMQAYLETSTDYDSLSDDTKATIANLVNQIDYEFADRFMTDEKGNLSSESIQQWAESLTTNLSNPKLQEAFNNLFDLDTRKSELGLYDYKKQFNELAYTISTAVPQISKDLLKSSTGYDDTVKSLQASYNKLALTFGTKEANFIKTGDLELAANLIAEDNFSGTFDEFLTKLRQAKTEASEDVYANPIFDSIATALESENRSDDYFSAVEYLQKAKELYDDNLTNTDDFKAIAKYLSPTGSDDEANFLENVTKASRYLTEDISGSQAFIQDLANKGFAELTTEIDANGKSVEKWKFNITDLNDTAQKMGIGFEFMMDMFGRLNDAGIKNNFFSNQEEATEHLTELYSDLAEEQQRLGELTTSGQYETSEGNTFGNQTAIDASKQKIADLEADIQQTIDLIPQMVDATAEQTARQTEAAMSSINALAEKRREILLSDDYSPTVRQAIGDQLTDQIRQIAQENYLTLNADLTVSDPQDAIDRASYQNGVVVSADIEVGNYDELIQVGKNAAEQFSDLKLINFDSEDLSYLQAEINTVVKVMKDNDLLNSDGTINISTNGAQEALQVLESLIARRQQLQDPTVMSVDTSKLSGDLYTVISTIQEYQAALDNLNALEEMSNAGIKVDTSQAQQEVSTLKEQISALVSDDNTAEIMADLGINEDSLSSLNEKISAITPEMMVEVGVDPALVDGYEAPEKDSIVKYDVDSTKVDDWVAPIKPGTVKYKADISSINNTNFNRTATIFYNTLGKVSTTKVNGTFSPAFANGSRNVALNKDQAALVNEEGLESRVHNGVWQIIPGGAHIESLSRGDIIFNASQTADLIRYGEIRGTNKHGYRALADGTARNVINAFSGGVGSGSASALASRNTFGTNDSKKSSEEAAKSSKSAAKSSANAASAAEDAADSLKEAFDNLNDWIEVRIDRITTMRDMYESYGDSVLDDQWSQQNENIELAIAENNRLIDVLSQAYDVYLKQADASGLSSDYKSKVQNGTIQIESIADEDLKARIDEYQKWYEKAIQAQTDLDSARIKTFELQIKKLENIEDDFENAANYISSISDTISATVTKMDTWGVLNTDTYYDYDYNKKLQKQQQELKQNYESYYATLEKEFNTLVANGTIKKNSDAWWEWNSKLQSIKKSIIECDTELIELQQTVQEFRFRQWTDQFDDLDNVNNELDVILDLLDEAARFDSNGKPTTSYFTEMTLDLEKLANARKEVALYGTLMQALKDDLDNGTISQQKYNEKLAEYKKSQLEAVSATKSARQSIIDLVVEGIEKETEAMQKLVDARKKDLEQQKNNADYAKSISSKQKEINKINAQIQSLSGDEANTAKIRQLNAQKAELEEDLAELKEDRQYELLSDGLDNFMEEFEQTQNDQITLIQSNMDEQNRIVQQALDQAVTLQSETGDRLAEIADQYGFEISQTIKDSVGSSDATGTVQGGTWSKSDDGWRYYNNDGTQIKGQDAELEWNGKTATYGFDENGILYQNEWKKNDDGSWNFYNWEGEKVKGDWVDWDGERYLIDDNGRMYSNEMVEKDGKLYYFRSWGGMVKNNWQDVGGERYYFGSDGAALQSQWHYEKDKDKWYYLQANGAMARNASVKYKDYYCLVDENGVWHPEWDTKNPDLKKYPNTYWTGTRSAKKGMALINEKGAEYVWHSDYGDLTQLKNSDIVLSHPQAEFLYDLSAKRKEVLESLSNSGTSAYVGDTNIENNFEFNIENIEGNFDSTILPQIQKIASQTFTTNMSKWENKMQNNKRKLGY